MTRLTLIITLLGALVLAACAPQAGQGTAPAGSVVATAAALGYRNITVTELSEMLRSKDFLFVNTHIPYEGEIAHTDAFIPYDQTEARLADYGADKSAKIVLYCRSGRMSAIAAQKLADLGYTNVYNVTGGMAAWQQAGFELLEK